MVDEAVLDLLEGLLAGVVEAGVQGGEVWGEVVEQEALGEGF